MPGGVPVDGIRVPGGPPAAPLILIMNVWGGSRVPNGITSGRDQGAAGIRMERPRSAPPIETSSNFLFRSPLNVANMYWVRDYGVL